MELLVSTIFLIFSSSLLPFSSSTNEDSLTLGKSIQANQTIISSGGNFALGFFSPTSSVYSYLGIWYNDNVPNKTVIWVANRQTPLPKTSLATFTISENGNFVLTNERNVVIWSSNVSVTRSDTSSSGYGVLSDIGNLELRHGTNSSALWQSFEHPSDTLMPEMKLGLHRKTRKQDVIVSWANDDDPRPGMFSVGHDPRGIPQVYCWKNDKIYWRSDVYNKRNILEFSYFKYIGAAGYFTYVNDVDYSYFKYGFYGNNQKLRVRLAPNGNFEVWYLVQPTNVWKLMWKYPTTRCDYYASCGPFSSCEVNESLPLCSCLTGFEPKNQKDWDNKSWTNGCVRKRELNCDRTDGFKKFSMMKQPDNAIRTVNISRGECEDQCLRNCSCTAYAYANVTEELVNCLNWYGPMIDLVHNNYTATDLYVRLHESELGTFIFNISFH